MFNKSVNHKKYLVTLKIAVVGCLCWMVLASNLTTQPSGTVQANNQELNKIQNQDPTKDRWLPTEGVAEVQSPSGVDPDPTVGCTTFDFAGGGTQGFTVESVQGLALWHGTNGLCRAFLTGHTTPFTFYYGQDGTCNYNTGARNASNLLSPPVSLVGKFAPFTVNFNYLLFVEAGGFDTPFVDISTNNGATWTQFLAKANLINDNQWHTVTANVTALVGAASSIRLRFRFDSVDNIANSTTGWHVDDIAVCGNNFNFCIQDDVTGDYLQFNSINGNYITKQCSTGFTASGTGTVTANGSTVTLSHNNGVQFVNATLNTSTHVGSARVSVRDGLAIRSFKINDSDTTNNTCACP